MLKGGIFSLGLASGVFFGIYLRDQGFTSGVMKAYKAFKHDPLSKENLNPKKMSFEEIYEYYRAGMLDDENMAKFQTMLMNKRYNKIDEISINELNSIIDQADFEEIKRKLNSNIYKK